tara:strand:+ start:363 stop:557 length:195 start_codon:yes stop_codon:yes gene_type:complete
MEFWYWAEGFNQLPPRSAINDDLWEFTRDLVSAVEERHPDAASLDALNAPGALFSAENSGNEEE